MADAAGFRRGVVAQLNELEDHGVEARVFNPLLLSWTVIRGNNRDHRKILVVDGEYAVLGGINISDEQAGDGIEGWRDTSLLVTGPVAIDAECVFAETWEQAGRAILGRNLPLTFLNPLKRAIDRPLIDLVGECCGQARFTPPPYALPDPGGAKPAFPFDEFHTADATVRVVASSPDTRNSPTYDLAIIGINGARERLDIACAYSVPPLNLRRAMLAAAERGVRVRLLLPKVTDVMLVREIGMRFYGDLLRAGARIYEWPHHILHSKTMAVDGGWLAVGSANMDSRSYFLNYEANLAATDPALAEIAHEQFARDIEQASELTLKEWERRGAKQKLLETVLIPAAGQY
jgi:cardiolipin synthase